ncbi:hypothetical protein [Blastococcus sp. CCUG 61487]|uniref:hypothetical protein n=1 Tax=Blastococcus sp. CCUG 61487 TaxID=1840703 RepID=UPI00148570CB|nr:hypothetical protein [Blastococcus sp. CCUG 61487]
MSRHQLRAQADGYGVHVDVRVDFAACTTPEELARALDLAAAEVRHKHAEAEER